MAAPAKSEYHSSERLERAGIRDEALSPEELEELEFLPEDVEDVSAGSCEGDSAVDETFNIGATNGPPNEDTRG
ncbi:MAG TPA: hypothetical protein VFS20_21830 [Longimicrobium sp.]|nr:hypothetical protein [Longimicrobium sp.]